MGVFENVKATIDVNINANGEQRITGKVLNGVLQEIVSASESSSSDLQESLSSLSEKVDKIGSKDFNPSGIYPDLTAGDLAGRGESVPASFGFRASGGKSIKDGRAYIKRIKGNSVVWNQMRDVAIKAQNEDKFGISVSTTLGSSLISCVGTYDGSTGDANIYNQPAFPSIPAMVGHKYLCMIVGNEKMQLTVFGLGATTSQIDFYAIVQCTAEGFVNLIPRINTNLASGTEINESIQFLCYDLTKMFQAGNEPTTIEEFNARVATLGVNMYAYNEGQVIHCNTESIKSVGDNAWDEQWENGTINVNTGDNIDAEYAQQQIRSKNFIRVLPNEDYYIALPQYLGSDGMWVFFYDEQGRIIEGYNGGSWEVAGNASLIRANDGFMHTASNASYIKFYMVSGYGSTYNHDILISLYHSGWKAQKDDQYQPYWQDTLPLPIISKYFPYGMKLAGAAHDEIRHNKASGKWEYSKGRIKSVDLGTFDYTTGSTNLADSKRMRALTKISDAIIPSSDAHVANILCGSYIAVSSNDNWQNSEGVCISADGYLYVYDKEKQDAASFKADMAGVMLYYESNDWEWVELDAEDQNFRDYYNVADFGTEMSQSNVPSAAFSADIIYQFNAVDMIREHEVEINELQSIIATMQAQLTSLTSPTNL